LDRSGKQPTRPEAALTGDRRRSQQPSGDDVVAPPLGLVTIVTTLPVIPARRAVGNRDAVIDEVRCVISPRE
jgi:hypothetical protein